MKLPDAPSAVRQCGVARKQVPKSWSLRPVERVSAPVRAQLVEQLRAAIASGALMPGDRLIEREICDATGASRPPVREALRQLEAEGLVTIAPNRGPRVASIGPEEARMVYDVRALLEGHALKCFTEKATPAMRKALRDAVRSVARATTTEDVAGILEGKLRYYDIVLQGADNEILYSMFNMLYVRMTLLRVTSLSKPGRPAEALIEVERVVEAVEAGDAEEAARLGIAHIEGAARAALSVLEAAQRRRPLIVPAGRRGA